MTPTKRLVEVSGVAFDADKNVTTYMQTRIDTYEDGSRKVLSYGMQEAEGELNVPQVLALEETRIIPADVDGVYYSETQTIGEPDSGEIAAPNVGGLAAGTDMAAPGADTTVQAPLPTSPNAPTPTAATDQHGNEQENLG